MQNEMEHNALYYALEKRDAEIVDLLFEYKVADRQNVLSDALHSALEKGDSMCAAVILKHIVKDKDISTISLASLYSSKDLEDLIGQVLQSDACILLFAAVYLNAKELVHELITSGVPINSLENTTGKTALMIAVDRNCPEIVALLMQKGADAKICNAQGFNALDWALKKSNQEITYPLLDHYAVELIGHEAFLQCKNDKVIHELRALMKRHYEVEKSGIYKELEGLKREELALILAVEEGYKALVSLFLKKGISPNLYTSDSRLLLEVAASNGFVDIVNLLLDHKAEINGDRDDPETPLISTVRNGHTDVVRILIERGADLNVTDDHKLATALIHSVRKGENNGITNLLLQAGADTQFKDYKRKTALVYAAEYRNLKNISLLLAHNASVYKAMKWFSREVWDEPQALIKFYMNEGFKNYADDPDRYIDWYTTQFLSKNRYLRTCVKGALVYPETPQAHNNCFHQTVLMWACILGHTQNVKKLLACNPPQWYINAQDKSGYTALIYAIRHKNKECIRLLLPLVKSGINVQAFEEVCYPSTPSSVLLHSTLTHAVLHNDIYLVHEILALNPFYTLRIPALKLATELEYKEITIILLLSMQKKEDGSPYAALFK